MSNSENQGSSLRDVSKGATLFVGGKGSSYLFQFILTIILTRTLGAALFGIYAFADSIIQVLVRFARLGSGKSMLKFIPMYSHDPTRRNKFAGLAYFTALIGSSIIAILIYWGAPVLSSYTLDSQLLIHTLQIFSLILPFKTLQKLTDSIFRSIERIEYQIIISQILEPIFKVLAAGSAILLGFSLLGIVAAIVISGFFIFTSALSLLYSRTDVRPDISGALENTSEFYNFSLPLTFQDIGSYLYKRVDVLMVGIILAEADVGVYQIAVLLGSLLVLPLTAFNQLFPSIISGLYSNGELEEMGLLYQTITRWIITITLLPMLVLIVYSEQVLLIFGPEFQSGSAVLILFAIAQFTNAFVGPSGYLLIMTDHQYLTMMNQWILGITNIILNYLFITRFGLIGAAVATASILAIINCLRVFEVWYTEGLFPYTKRLWKPIVSGIIAGISMFVWKPFLNEYLLLFVGASSGFIVFSLLLIGFGIEEHDIEFFEGNLQSVYDT